MSGESVGAPLKAVPPMTPAPKPPKSGPRARTPIARTRMKTRGPRTKKSGGHLFPATVDEARRAHCRTFPCVACVALGVAQRSPTLACHLKSRGSAGPDVGNLWPGCDQHHTQQHVWGLALFQKKHRVNLKRVCERIERHYVEQSYVEFGGNP